MNSALLAVAIPAAGGAVAIAFGGRPGRLVAVVAGLATVAVAWRAGSPPVDALATLVMLAAATATAMILLASLGDEVADRTCGIALLVLAAAVLTCAAPSPLLETIGLVAALLAAAWLVGIDDAEVGWQVAIVAGVVAALGALALQSIDQQGTAIAALCGAVALAAGLAPVGAWSLRAHSATRSTTRALLSTVVPLTALVVLARAVPRVAPLVDGHAELLRLAGAAAALLAAVTMARSTSVSQLLAGSTAQHAAIVVFALGCGQRGAEAAVLHLLAQTLARTQITLAAGEGERGGGAAFALGALAIAGVPPSLPFLSSGLILAAGFTAAPWSTAAVLVAMVAGFLLLLATARQAIQHPAKDPGSMPRIAVAVVGLLTIALYASAFCIGPVHDTIVAAGQTIVSEAMGR